MKYPLRIEFVSHPADADHCIVVDAEHETVGELWSATREEATELVRMANLAAVAVSLTTEEAQTVLALRDGTAKVFLTPDRGR